MQKETHAAETPGPATPPSRLAPGRYVPPWLVLGIVCIGQFMVVLDASIVNVALPSIQRDLHFSTSNLQWIVNAYTLTFAGFLLLGGRAADLFGRRRIFLVGLAVFTVSSLLGGLAQSEAWLIGARALQGLGAAILAPATLTILTATFAEGPARARALGAWSAVSAAGASAGALFGGILTDFLELALDPLRQRAGRDRRARRGPPLPPRVEGGHGAPPPRPGRGGHGDRRAWSRWCSPSSAPRPTRGDRRRSSCRSWLGVVLIAVFLFLQARVSKAPLVPLAHLPLPLGRRRQRRDVDDVRRAVRVLVLRDALHAARAGLQPAPGRPRLPAPDPAHRRRGAGDGAPGPTVRPPPAHPRSARWWPAAGWPGWPRSRPDSTFVGRPLRTLRAHRAGHGPRRDADRRGRYGRGAPGGGGPRLGPAQHVADGRRRPSASPRWPRWRPTARRARWPAWPATPAHTAAALTDGYALAFSVAAGRARRPPPPSPWPRCPSLRRAAGRPRPVRARRPRTDRSSSRRRTEAPDAGQVCRGARRRLGVDGVDDHGDGVVQAALGVDVEQVDGVLDLLAGVLDVLERLGGPGVRRPRLDVLAHDDDRQQDQLEELGARSTG